MVSPTHPDNLSVKGSGKHVFGALLLIILYLMSAFSGKAQTLPSGFSQVQGSNIEFNLNVAEHDSTIAKK